MQSILVFAWVPVYMHVCMHVFTFARMYVHVNIFTYRYEAVNKYIAGAVENDVLSYVVVGPVVCDVFLPTSPVGHEVTELRVSEVLVHECLNT